MALAAFGATPARADGAHVDVVTFDRAVDPPAAHFLTDAIDTAQHDGATALVIQIDTPGGDIGSMNTIAEKILNASVPVVSYVAPSGAHAASAGAVIALAAPLVAMAPGTRIGASSPVDGSGNNLQTTLDTKIKEDTSALMRREQTGFNRNRNADTAVQMVMNAKSYDDAQAVADHTVDMQASSMDDLLTNLDGRQVTLANHTSATLRTAGLPQRQLEPTFANQVQAVLFDPNVLFLIFILAAVCIYLELSHPGAILPGTIGAIALLLFLFTAGALQPNWAGLALMLLAIVLLAIDVRAPTHGILTAGALISLVLGALIFFDTGTNRAAPTLNPFVLVGVVAAVAVLSAAILRAAIRAQRFPVKTGREGLIGERAKVVDALSPDGRVRILGENWAARLAEPFAHSGEAVEAGTEVRVVRVDGLTLVVEPIFALGEVTEGAVQWTR
jgi:membrane-bound serine protease (ClpP class)